MRTGTRFGRLLVLLLAVATFLVGGAAGATADDDAKQGDAVAKAQASSKGKKGETDHGAEAAARADAKATAKAEKASAKAAKSTDKAENSDAKIAANAEVKAAAEVQKDVEQAVRTEPRAAVHVPHRTEVAAKATSQTQAPATSPPGSVNQGEESKVLTVNGASCSTDVVAGAKVEGGLGTTVQITATAPIVKVTLKSGQGAAVVSSSFSSDFKSVTITLSKDVSNYVVWTCGLAPPTHTTDVCPNIAGVQGTVPAGMVKDAHGNCVAAPTHGHETDVCPNIAGVQGTVPAGMVKDAHGNCVAAPTHGHETDVCPNIAGVQGTVPAGMVKDAHGNCVTAAVAGHTDLCLNIAGVQTSVPVGMVRDAHGNCAAAATGHVAGSPQTPSPPHAAPVTGTGTAAELDAVTPSRGAEQTEDEQESGVLGATASAPQDSIAETATRGTLPFTGVPLWIVALMGAALLLGGFALRRTAQH
jgi:hypothetical protein